MIEKLYKNGRIPVSSVKAVTKGLCQRCYGKQLYEDQRGVHYCLECHDYGEVNEQMTLYRFTRDVPYQEPTLVMPYALSKAQQKGSDFLLSCFRQRQSGCLQAVCGAGKTEMTFALVFEALKQAQKIAIIIPRVEVIKEVYHRYVGAFPKTTINAIFEGQKHENNAQLLISTPQQMLVFYHEFDLMIIDEVDAFPYVDNPFLERLTYKALSPKGICISMSATMPKTVIDKGLPTCVIPSRYHYQPLVVPTFVRIKSKNKSHQQLLDALKKKPNPNRQTLIFVPTKKDSQHLYEVLNAAYRCQYVHSAKVDKREIIKAFRQKAIDILVTTTLLERGVTFVDIDVYVLDADHQVFNRATLIQIAGRVGRHHQYSQGQLLFFSTYLTKPMKQAKNDIIYMNLKNSQHAMQTL